MWELDHKEGWVLKNWCFRIVVLEKTLESPLDCKEIKPVNPKGNQLWIFTGRTGAKAEAAIFWPPDTKNWFIGEDPDAGNDWGQEEKGMTEDEMAGFGSPTQWTWDCANSGRLCRTEKTVMLQSMGSQKVGHNLVTEQQPGLPGPPTFGPYKLSGLISFLLHMSRQHWLPCCSLITPGTLAMGLWDPSASFRALFRWHLLQGFWSPGQYSTPVPSPTPIPSSIYSSSIIYHLLSFLLFASLC